jgi:hypothetical protein
MKFICISFLNITIREKALGVIRGFFLFLEKVASQIGKWRKGLILYHMAAVARVAWRVASYI